MLKLIVNLDTDLNLDIGEETVLNYKEYSAGSIMTSEYIALKKDITEAIVCPYIIIREFLTTLFFINLLFIIKFLVV